MVANSTDDESTGDDLYNITFKSLQSKTDRILPSPQPDLWLKYFKYLFTGTNVSVDPETDLLYVTNVDMDFVQRILPYVFGTPALHIELYMWWHTVYAMIMNTSTFIADFIDKQLDLLGSQASYVARSRLAYDRGSGYCLSYNQLQMNCLEPLM